MGIPSFQRLLAPYATPLVLAQSSTPASQPDSRSHIAIIDGPALAYHALHLAQSQLQTRLAQHQQRRRTTSTPDSKQDPTAAAATSTSTTSASRLGQQHRQASAAQTLAGAHAATPSFRCVAAAMLGWLDALQRHGICVRAVLFDGALPLAKVGVRRERMVKLLLRLQECRQTLSETTAEEAGDDAEAEDDEVARIRLGISDDHEDAGGSGSNESSAKLWNFHNGLSAHAGTKMAPARGGIDFPPPVHLVAAMLECLRGHEQYALVTRMVPGEADPYCAAWAQDQPAGASVLVMTSDSDLFAYELREHVQVVLLKDVWVDDAKPERTSWHAQAYCTHKIAQHLNIESLLPLAYSVHTDRHRSLGAHLLEARQAAQQDPAAYAAFRQQYALPSLTYHSIVPSSALQALDTKLSELVHAWLDTNGERTSTTLDIYLPTGHEDAERASAYALSTSAHVRQLAYAVLLHSHRPATAGQPHPPAVLEHMRRGTRIAPVQVQPLTAAEAARALAQQQQTLDAARTALATTPCKLSWRALGLWLLCAALHSSSDSTHLPSKRILTRLYCGHVPRDWPTTHLRAQLLALLDAWRTLHQCLALTRALAATATASSYGHEHELAHAATLLLATLDALPGATLQAMLNPLRPGGASREEARVLVDAVYVALGAVEVDAETGKRRKKRRQQGQRQGGDGAQMSLKRKVQVGANMFGMLADRDE